MNAVDQGQPQRESIQEIIHGLIISNHIHPTLEGLMTIFHWIAGEIESTQQKLRMASNFGILFFLDRVLIHDMLFAAFLGYNRSTIAHVLDNPEFGRMTLTRGQFEALAKTGQIRGSRFDWHVYRYPFNTITELLVARLHRLDAESFALAVDQVQPVQVQQPHLTRSHLDSLSIPPTKSNRLRFANKKMEEVMSLFISEPPQGRCWLLYLDNDNV